jgi:hypothetical protein
MACFAKPIKAAAGARTMANGSAPDASANNYSATALNPHHNRRHIPLLTLNQAQDQAATQPRASSHGEASWCLTARAH